MSKQQFISLVNSLSLYLSLLHTFATQTRCPNIEDPDRFRENIKFTDACLLYSPLQVSELPELCDPIERNGLLGILSAKYVSKKNLLNPFFRKCKPLKPFPADSNRS